MHLTNYAINKENPNYQYNEDEDECDVGHKRALTAVFKYLQDKGHDVHTLWDEIR